MPHYRIAVNMEWTSKCNARCVMCPQHLIEKPQLMREATFDRVLARLDPKDAFRVVVAGYGEPTTHPHFESFIDKVAAHPARFDMVTNGHLFDEEKIRHVDGKLNTVVISFSSIVPEVYDRVHVGLDLERVCENIACASRTLKQTKLAISLTPMPECLDTLPETISWLRSRGVTNLTMSPTLYNRGGTLKDHQAETLKLREMIRTYGLHSQELDFVGGLKDVALQNWHNRFRCIPRNSDLFITAAGEYLYCYNDVTHHHVIGHVNDMSLREALAAREKTEAIEALCGSCNMRDRYRPAEVATVARNYLAGKLIPARLF